MSHRDHTRVETWRRSYAGKRMLTSYGHYKNAEAQHKAEFFMSHRDMCRYWDGRHDPLYYPLSMYSRYLKYYVNEGRVK